MDSTFFWISTRQVIGNVIILFKNKTRPSKVGAISEAQKSAKHFFGKKLETLKNCFFQKISHSAEKCKRGDPFGFINIHSVAKNKKNSKGDPLGTFKKFRIKSRTVPIKIQKGDPLCTSGFVGFLEKVKNERGTLWTKFALAGLGLRWFQDCF